jgi:hypothetical protein
MDQKKKSTTFKLFYYAMILPLPAILIPFLTNLLNSEEVKSKLTPYIPANWDIESKFILIASVATLCTSFVFFNIWFIALLRCFLIANPLGDDPFIIKLLNRILSNTLEQFVVFFPALICWTIRNSTEDQKYQVLLYGLIWFIGRILFLLGYMLSFIHVDLAVCRSIGLGITMLTTASLYMRLIYNI